VAFLRVDGEEILFMAQMRSWTSIRKNNLIGFYVPSIALKHYTVRIVYILRIIYIIECK